MPKSLALVALLTVVGLMVACEPVVSGVPVGQRPGPYSFIVATGPQRGQPTCYVCEQADKPTVIVFARSLSDPLGQLLQKLDAVAVVKRDAGFKTWMTQLTDTADLDGLAKWSTSLGLKDVPVGAFEDADGPPAYKLAADADVTVLVVVKQKVTANVAVKAGQLTPETIGTVMTAVGELWAK